MRDPHHWSVPALLGDAPVICTRLGIAPNNVSFRLGVLRTHMLAGVFVHAIARRCQATPTVYVRFDDTDSLRTGGNETAGLLAEVREVAQVPISPVPLHIGDGAQELFQSRRASRYQQALSLLRDLGVTQFHDGVECVSLLSIDQKLEAAGQDPNEIVSTSLVNINRVQVEHPRDLVPLTRGNGLPLWHLASVVDDVDLGVNIVVRGTDKVNAVAIQERLRWVLTGGRQRVSYIFLPRLMEADRSQSRISHLLSTGLRPSSIRWYLMEPFLRLNPAQIPWSFAEIVPLLRTLNVGLRDSEFDLTRLRAMDRKVSAQMSPEDSRRELNAVVGDENPRVVDVLATLWRRPLADQIHLYEALTATDVQFAPAPQDARASIGWLTDYLNGAPQGIAPSGVRWVLTGQTVGPPVDNLVSVMSAVMARRRLVSAERILAS